VNPGRNLNRFVQDARLCDDYTIGGVNAKNTLHAFKRHRNTASFGQAAARGTGTASPRRHRHFVSVAERQDLANLEAGYWKHYYVRGTKPAAIVVGIGKTVHYIRQYPLDR